MDSRTESHFTPINKPKLPINTTISTPPGDRSNASSREDRIARWRPDKTSISEPSHPLPSAPESPPCMTPRASLTPSAHPFLWVSRLRKPNDMTRFRSAGEPPDWDKLCPTRKLSYSHSGRIEEEEGMGELAPERCTLCKERGFECKVYSPLGRHLYTRPGYGGKCSRCLLMQKTCTFPSTRPRDEEGGETGGPGDPSPPRDANGFPTARPPPANPTPQDPVVIVFRSAPPPEPLPSSNTPSPPAPPSRPLLPPPIPSSQPPPSLPAPPPSILFSSPALPSPHPWYPHLGDRCPLHLGRYYPQHRHPPAFERLSTQRKTALAHAGRIDEIPYAGRVAERACERCAAQGTVCRVYTEEGKRFFVGEGVWFGRCVGCLVGGKACSLGRVKAGALVRAWDEFVIEERGGEGDQVGGKRKRRGVGVDGRGGPHNRMWE